MLRSATPLGALSMEVTQFMTGQAHNRSSTQRIKHTTGQAHNGSSTQRVKHTTGQAHNRPSTQQAKHTTGQAHNGSSTQQVKHTTGQAHNTNRSRRLDRKTYIWGDQSFADISKLALANLVQQLHVMFTECLAKYWTCVRLTDLCIVSSSCCVCVRVCV